MRFVTQGFTLVELVVVIALTGILVAVAAPRFASGDVFETRGDAGLLSSTLRYAQKTAIAQRKKVFVIYNDAVEPNTVSLCFDPNCGAAQVVINPETAGAYVLTFSRSVTVRSSNKALGFDGLGRADPNELATYSVTNKKNALQSVGISVEANTGYIH